MHLCLAKLLQKKKSVTNVYLTRLFHFNGYDMVSIAAELAGPGTPLTDPLQQAQLMCIPNRPITSAGVQQLPLKRKQFSMNIYAYVSILKR